MTIVLTRDALARLFPRAPAAIRAAIEASQEGPLARFGITASARRLAFFLAQAAEESGGFTRFSENLSYSAARMREVWPRRFPTLAAARPYERAPQRLADKVYAGRMGNGPEGSGDGWRYRGRGPIQLTGRANYREIGAFLGIDLEADPDLALDDRHLMAVQAAYWEVNRLNRFADAGDFVGLTKAINGGLTNLAERQRWLAKVEAEIGAAASRPVVAPPAEAPPPGPASAPATPTSGKGGLVSRLLRALFRRSA
jgi:putative chitinase